MVVDYFIMFYIFIFLIVVFTEIVLVLINDSNGSNYTILETEIKFNIPKRPFFKPKTYKQAIENHINNLTIQEALDIVDKKVEGRK